jgi:hypothetical protein
MAGRAHYPTTRRPRRDWTRFGSRGALAGLVAAVAAPKVRRDRVRRHQGGPVELRLRVTPEMFSSLEAGVPCREVRVERVGEGDQIALLLRASDREQWLMNVVAHARRAAWN